MTWITFDPGDHQPATVAQVREIADRAAAKAAASLRAELEQAHALFFAAGYEQACSDLTDIASYAFAAGWPGRGPQAEP